MKKISSTILALIISANIFNVVQASESGSEETTLTNQTHAVMGEYVSDWAREYISRAREVKIIPDHSDNFTVPISREKFCEYVYNLIMSVNRSITTPEAERKFNDTDNEKVHILNQAGIINGKTDTEFAPDDFLTREEAATIIVRMINREMPMAVTEMFFEYEDNNEISQWASEAVQIMSNLGFMNGTGENKFEPKGTYTAEQAVATLVRVYEATRRTYVYRTPLGTIESENNYDSYINFAIQCNAIIGMTKDVKNFTQSGFKIEKQVKALTDQTTSVLISINDFAEIFGGEWKLNNGVFEFNYDTEKEVEVVEWKDFMDGESREWPNKSDAVPVIRFEFDMSKILINGEETQLLASYGGKIYNSSIAMYENELYIPVYMVAQLLGYESAGLQVIYED